ncbi:hypothetical protein [Sorangium sp. So ce542]|uniref:hypothetical protein n=1 Tax=Sorangium sp. So ce542 TaxID=3133316 RepID=UPI003F6243A7
MNAATIRSLLHAHPFYKARLNRLRHRASQLLHITGPLSDSEILAVESYVLNRPERFFDRDCFLHTHSLLRQISPDALLIPGNITTSQELNQALTVVRRTNYALGDPRRESYTDERRQHALMEDIFPDYARLAEYAYGALVGYVAELQAIARGKPYNKPITKGKDASPLRNRWDIARRWLPHSFHDCFNPNIRNAIIHANTTIDGHSVRFEDLSGPEIIVPISKAEEITSNLLDVCNGIAGAIVAHNARVASSANNQASTLQFLRTQGVIASANTDLFQNESCFESRAGGRPQIELIGTHAHWRLENLLFDAMRALVYAKHYFPEAQQVFISHVDQRRASSFYSLPTDSIPSLDEPADAASRLARTIGSHGFYWIEHESIAAAIASKFRGIGSSINWLHAVPVTMSFDPQHEPEYELRELIDISVGARERFRAIVVSDPRGVDLGDTGLPTRKYLDFLFRQSLNRWLFRRRQARPLAVNRIRFLQCAVLEVHRTDRRLRRLRDTGLHENFLFRFEWGFGAKPSVALLGSTLETLGPYTVTVNTAARPFLRERAGRNRSSGREETQEPNTEDSTTASNG